MIGLQRRRCCSAAEKASGNTNSEPPPAGRCQAPSGLWDTHTTKQMATRFAQLEETP